MQIVTRPPLKFEENYFDFAPELDIASPALGQSPHPQGAGVTVLVQPQLGPGPGEALTQQLETGGGAGGEHEASDQSEVSIKRPIRGKYHLYSSELVLK